MTLETPSDIVAHGCWACECSDAAGLEAISSEKISRPGISGSRILLFPRSCMYITTAHTWDLGQAGEKPNDQATRRDDLGDLRRLSTLWLVSRLSPTSLLAISRETDRFAKEVTLSVPSLLGAWQKRKHDLPPPTSSFLGGREPAVQTQ